MISAFSEAVAVLSDFINTLFTFELAGPIMVMVGVILALAVYRIVT